MARILGSEGLIMNQSNSNAYVRYYSRGKNDSGGYIRFTVGAGNPRVHILVKAYYAATQTNGSFDFMGANTRWMSLYCDTNGNMFYGFAHTWGSGANVDMNFDISTRQADLYLVSTSNGGFPVRASVMCEIYCDRWDYLTISNL